MLVFTTFIEKNNDFISSYTCHSYSIFNSFQFRSEDPDLEGNSVITFTYSNHIKINYFLTLTWSYYFVIQWTSYRNMHSVDFFSDGTNNNCIWKWSEGILFLSFVSFHSFDSAQDVKAVVRYFQAHFERKTKTYSIVFPILYRLCIPERYYWRCTIYLWNASRFTIIQRSVEQ